VTLVLDASVVVAALVDTGTVGSWAESLLVSDDLAAPHLMPVEVANTLRRAVRAGDLSEEAASLAHADLTDLRVQFAPYEIVAERVWELRHTISAYDAWYVALAEELEATLATVDRALRRASGPRCNFAVPEPSGGR
jgi:predicted nucleic acid-binding protein